MYLKYEKLERVLFKAEQGIVLLAFITIFATVVEQVIQRFFNLPIPDSSDISLVAQGVFTFFSLGMLVYTGGHITIEVHKMMKNKVLLFYVEIAMHLSMLVFGAIFIWLSYDLFIYAMQTGSATMALRVPMWIPYGSMLLGLIFMVLHTIGAILREFYYKANPSERKEDEVNLESMR